MHKPRRRRRNAQAGITLIELLVVMVILGLLAAFVTPKLFGKVDKAKIQAVRTQCAMFDQALDAYRLDVGRYPDSLQDLRQSSVRGWEGPYLKKEIPPDPWGDQYVYEVIETGRDYHISSPAGGQGEPIRCWEAESTEAAR